MKPTQQLREAGQSLWLDNITREMLRSGKLRSTIADYSLSGLTSNPSIFDKAIEKSDAYDDDIASGLARGLSPEDIFFQLAIADLRQAADLFRPLHELTCGVDGWVSLEVSPLLADEAEQTIEAARSLHRRAERANLYIKIPGTEPGLRAIEESIFSGVPINVTLLFSAEQYRAAAEAYLRGLERRVEAGLSPDVSSVASIFVSRWDKKLRERLPQELHDRIGIAAASDAYRVYRELLDSDRFQRLANLGARPQRLLFASTSTKDPDASDVLYVEALAAPHTVNTMPDETLFAFADHGKVVRVLDRSGGDAREVLEHLSSIGSDPAQVAKELQQEGAEAFDDSWQSLLACIEGKAHSLQEAS